MASILCVYSRTFSMICDVLCARSPAGSFDLLYMNLNISYVCNARAMREFRNSFDFPQLLCSTNNNIKLFIRESNHSSVKRDVVQQQICSFYRTLHRAALYPLLLFNMLMMFSWVELLNSDGKKLILKIAQHSIQPRPLSSLMTFNVAFSCSELSFSAIHWNSSLLFFFSCKQ